MAKKNRKNKNKNKKPVVIPDNNTDEKVSIPKGTKITLIVICTVLGLLIIGGLWYYGTHSTLERSDKTVSKKIKEADKEKDSLVKEANETSEIAYYDDVADYIDSMEDKNGELTSDESEVLVDKEYGDGVYKKFIDGLLPSKRLTPSEIEQILILGRWEEENIELGYTYKNLTMHIDGTIDNKDVPYKPIGEGSYYLPTTDGFQEIGDGSHIGYPYASKMTTTSGTYLLLNALVYFDKDMTLKELGDYKVNLKLANNDSNDFKTAFDLDSVDELMNNMENTSYSTNPYNLLGNFGGAVIDENTYIMGKVYNGSNQNNNIKLAKGGILTYSVIVNVDSDDISKLNDKLDVYIGDTKTSITKSAETEDVEFKVVK